MAIKKVERVDTGVLFLHSFMVSLIFFVLMVVALHFLNPSFDLSDPWRFEVIFPVVAVALLPLTLYIFNRPYRSSISWIIQIPMPSETAQDYLQPNIDNTVSYIKDKLSVDRYLVKRSDHDRYDRFFERGDSIKLVCEDSFVLYINGDVNRLGIINIRLMLRILSLNKESIKKLDQQLERVVDEIRPIT